MDERLVQLIDFLGMSIREFEREISVGEGLINKIIVRKSSPKVEVVEKIVEKFPQISLEWLVLGKGEILKKYGQKSVNVTSSPQSNVANGDMKIEAPAELVAIIAKQQETIDRLTITVDKLLQNK